MKYELRVTIGGEEIARERITIEPEWPGEDRRLVQLPATPPSAAVTFCTFLDGTRFDVTIAPDPEALAMALAMLVELPT